MRSASGSRAIAGRVPTLYNSRVVAFAWNIVRFSVCASCGLGPDGGLGHLCRGRWGDVRRAAIPAMEPDGLPRRRRLEKMSAEALRRVGRVPFPMLRRGDAEFLQLTWDDATKLVARRLGGGGTLLEGDRALSVEARDAVDALAARLSPGDPLLILGSMPCEAAFRAHVTELLTPEIVAPVGDEVVVLPALSRYSQTGGAHWRGPDDVVRYSPEIRGNPVPGARPDHEILGTLAADLPTPGTPLHSEPVGGQ